MKKVYVIGAALFAITTIDVSAQNALMSRGTEEPVTPLTDEISSFKGTKAITHKNTSRDVVYYSEDFSNGLDGQNGEWTTAGTLAEYWFQSFPSEDPNGYQPLEPLGDGNTVYGPFLANYFGTRTPIDSETRDNGFMMIDGDRYNSTRTAVDEPLGPNTTSNAFTAELISPVIDLTGAETAGAELEYHTYQRLCCSGYFLGLSWSFDGGTSWSEPLDVFAPQAGNADVDEIKNFCLNEQVLGNPNLTQFRFKFIWAGSQSHYFWMIDDIKVQESSTNDIVVTNTFLTRHEEVFFAPESTYSDYFASFEYDVTPDYLLKPLEFGAAVSNPCSQNLQTDLVLTAVITPENGDPQTVTSTPLPSLPTGEDTLIFTEPIFLDNWNEANPGGLYTVTFEVQQAEEDVRPENNIGGERTFRVSTDDGSEGFAIAQNGGRTYNGAFTQLWITQDALVNTPYVFQDPAITNSVITHVEVVFLNSPDFAETVPGESVFFNLRQGSVPDEDPDDPTTATSVFFGSDPYLYTDFDLEYVIEEGDLWNPATDGFPQNWTSFELPTPVLIEAGVIYSPEVSIQASAGEVGIVFFPVANVNQERQAMWWRNFSPNSAGGTNIWSTGAGTPVPSLRLRTSAPLSVEKVTYEEGIKITQNWPNPFTTDSKFQYQLDQTSQVTFEIRDITGKLMHRESLGTVAAGTVNTYYLDGNKLSAGIYTYSILTKDVVVTRKMVVE